MTDLRRVDWNGLTAFYTPQEDMAMRALKEAGASSGELAVLHALHGLFDARLVGR